MFQLEVENETRYGKLSIQKSCSLLFPAPLLSIVASGGSDKSVKGVQLGECIATLTGHTNCVCPVRVAIHSPVDAFHNFTDLSDHGDKKIRVYQSTNHTVLATLTGL